jgi:hypothetical protein
MSSLTLDAARAIDKFETDTYRLATQISMSLATRTALVAENVRMDPDHFREPFPPPHPDDAFRGIRIVIDDGLPFAAFTVERLETPRMTQVAGFDIEGSGHWVSVTPPPPKPHSCDLPAWWRMEFAGKGDGSIWRCQCGQNYKLTVDVGFVKITPEEATR